MIEGFVQVDAGARWLRMADPMRVIEATRPADVAMVVRQVHAETRSRRCQALGLIRYEAGPEFDLEVADAVPYALPLARFALFESNHVHVADRTHCTRTA